MKGQVIWTPVTSRSARPEGGTSLGFRNEPGQQGKGDHA